MRSKPLALIIGAGAVGRGLLAPKLLDSGYRVKFIDVNWELISQIRSRKWYPLCGDGEVRWIGPVSIEASSSYFMDKNRETPDVIFVSVRPQNLLEATRNLPQIVTDQTVYVVENLTNAAQKVFEYHCDNKILKVRGAIANVIVPLSPFQQDDISYTVLDKDAELVLEKLDDDPELISHAKYTNNFDYEWDLKLHLHCTVHAVAAYLGIVNNLEYIHDVVRNPKTGQQLMQCVHTIALTLTSKYPEKKNAIYERMNHELESMNNDLLMDDVYRVARDADRKLMPDGRLIGTAAMIRQYDFSIEFMLMLIKFFLNRSSFKTASNLLTHWKESNLEFADDHLFILNRLT